MLMSLFFSCIKRKTKRRGGGGGEGGKGWGGGGGQGGDRKKNLGNLESLEFSSKMSRLSTAGLALALYSLLNDLSFGVGRLFSRTTADCSLLLL